MFGFKSCEWVLGFPIEVGTDYRYVVGIGGFCLGGSVVCGVVYRGVLRWRVG